MTKEYFESSYNDEESGETMALALAPTLPGNGSPNV